MDKILLEEIKRTQILMGINPKSNFIFEQNVMALLKAAMAGGSKYVDDLIKFTIKTIEKGGTISAKQIDELCEYVKSTGKYTDEEIETLKNFLKKPKVLKKLKLNKGLYNNIDDYADDITESESKVLSKLVSITDDEIKAIVKNQANKELKLLPKLPLEDEVETAVVNNVDTIISAGKKVGSVENVIWKPLDDFFVNQYVKSESSLVEKTVDEAYAAEMSLRMRNNPKVKEAVKKLEDSGLMKTSDDTATAEMKPITRDQQTAMSKTTETFENDVITKEYNKVKDKADSQLTTKEKDYKETVKDWETDTTIKQESVESKIESQPPKEVYDELEKINSKSSLTADEQKLLDEYNSWKNSPKGAGIDGRPLSQKEWQNMANDVIIESTGLNKLGKNFQDVGVKWQQKFAAPFTDFYFNYLSPYWDWFVNFWSVQIKSKRLKLGKITGKVENTTELFDIFSKDLDSVVQKEWARFNKNYPKDFDEKTLITFSQGGLRRVQRKIATLRTEGTPIKQILSDGSIKRYSIEEMWGAFKKNAKSKIPTDIQSRFDEFCKLIDDLPENNRYLSIKQLFERGIEKEGQSTVKMTDNLVEKTEQAFNKSASEFIDSKELLKKTKTLINKLKPYIPNLRAGIMGGRFKSPKELQTYLITKGFKPGSTNMIYIKGLIAGAFWWGVIEFFVELSQSAYYSIMELENPISLKYGEEGWGLFWSMAYQNIIVDGLMGNGPIGLVKSSLDESGWGGFVEDVIPGYADNTVFGLIEILPGILKSGNETAKEKTQRVANEKSINSINDILITKMEEDFVYKDTSGSVVKNILNLIQNPEIKEFMKDKIEFINEVPKDYVAKYLEKTRGTKVSLDGLDAFLTKIKLTPEEIIKEMNDKYLVRGSAVAIGKSGNYYLIMTDNRSLPDLTEKDHQKFSNENQSLYVEPKFDDLKPGTTRIFKTFEEFKNNYNNL